MADSKEPAKPRRRVDVRNTLLELAGEAWRGAETFPDSDAMARTVEWARSADPPRMTMGFAWEFRAMMAHCPDVESRAACYRCLVAELRPVFSGTGDGGGRRAGWVYLLTDAGKVAFGAKHVGPAAELLDEAWSQRGYLPAGTAETAKATAHLALAHAATVGWLPFAPPGDPHTVVLDRLATARELLDQHENTLGIMQARVRLALAEAQLWYVLRRNDQVGYLTAARRRVEILVRAEGEMWQGLVGVPHPAGAARELAALPPGLRPPFASLLAALAAEADVCGDSHLALDAARDAFELSERPHQLLDARITLARVQRRLDDRLHENEELLRDIESGVADRLNDWQRRRIAGRLYTENLELARLLQYAGKPTAAWFWQRQAQTWLVERADVMAVAAQREPARAGSASESSAVVVAAVSAQSTWLKNVRDSVRRENVRAAVLNLMKASDTPESLDTLLVGIEELAAWWPPGRAADPNRTAPATCRTRAEVELVALQLAAEFVDTYAGYLGGQIYGRLARNQRLPWEQRHTWALRAYESSVETGRSVYALSAKENLLELAFERGDTDLIAESVRDMVLLIRSLLSSAMGAADLIDVADEMIGRCTHIAGQLAARGHARFAFEVAAAGLGAIRNMIAADPVVADEFELVEQRARERRSDEVSDRLFELMRRRVIDRAERAAPPLPSRGDVAVSHFGPSVSLVQLLNTAGTGCWALGLTYDNSTTTHWTARLDLDQQHLHDLRKGIWHQFFHGRQDRGVRMLRDLYQQVIEPIAHHVGTSEDVVFVLHRDFSGLPIHAARGADDYLVQRHRVGYLPSTDSVGPVGAPPGTALVGGWDSRIKADIEAAELHRRLAELGCAVTRPAEAASGRSALLDLDGAWGVVHLAAHGDFRPWPASMRSRLQLAADVSIHAGEWLKSGCRAGFVFLNICSVGRSITHAGDLNGFPLALHARGTVSNISALSPVDSDLAQRFARSFYQGWPGNDSLTAYRTACVEAIDAGVPLPGWAPYLHTGIPLGVPTDAMQPEIRAGVESVSSPVDTV